MQTVSSYGVELRKQNIPLRQTLGIYRSAVCYLTEVYGKAWEELSVIPDAKRQFNVAEHLVHTTKKNSARFDLTSAFPRCHPISGGLPSSMRLERYPLMKHGWNYGKKKGKEPESPGLCMKTMPCQFFTAE